MRARRELLLSVFFATAFAAGCGSDRTGSMKPGQTLPDGGGPVEGQEACAKMDLLFIIDNSGSMEEEQGNLGANFPKFIQLLDDFKTSAGDILDYRIGVTTTGRTATYSAQLPGFPPVPPITEVGDNGKLRYLPDCGMQQPWINRPDPNVSSTFACVAQVGTNGPGYEMQLGAIKTSMGDRIADGVNAGFLREAALLAVIILTDENDCSREDDNFTISPFDVCDEAIDPNIKPVQSYLDFLDALKGGRNRWAATVIAAPGPGSCSSNFGDAAEAVRLKKFTDLAGNQAVFSSICAGDLTQALGTAMTKFTAACESFNIL